MSTLDENDRNASLSTAKPKPSTLYTFDASKSGFSYAANDLREAFSRFGLALSLIRAGFIQRHNGFLQAIFWILLLNVATVGGMSILWGRIFGADLNFYLPYVACGLIVWGLISSLMNGAAGVFIAARGTYTQTSIPRSLFAIRCVGIEFLSFAIRLLVLAGAMAIVARVPDVSGVLLSIVGVALIAITGFSLCLSIGVLGARFRDIPNLMAVGLTFAFFVTPVFWSADRLGDLSWVVMYNPLHHFLNTVRGPLLGLDGVEVSFIVAGGITLLSSLVATLVYGIYARRLNYWN